MIQPRYTAFFNSRQTLIYFISKLFHKSLKNSNYNTTQMLSYIFQGCYCRLAGFSLHYITFTLFPRYYLSPKHESTYIKFFKWGRFAFEGTSSWLCVLPSVGTSMRSSWSWLVRCKFPPQRLLQLAETLTQGQGLFNDGCGVSLSVSPPSFTSSFLPDMDCTRWWHFPSTQAHV